MTKLLEKAFQEAAKLSEDEQEALARWLLAELESERKWLNTFAASADALESLADEAMEEHRKGLSRDLDPDQL